jgi:hypothetical protein
VESVVSKLPQTLGMELRGKIRCMLKKPKSSMPNMTTKELKAVKSLTLNKDIKILQVDKGNCTVVLVESKYKNKLYTLLDFEVYDHISFLNCSSYMSKTYAHSIPQQTSAPILSFQDS